MSNPNLPSISVIIVTYNGAPCLRPTLEAVLGQDYPDYEVILLDNDSTDASLQIAREFAPRGLRVIASPINRGYGGGNNDAVAASRGEIIFLLSPDAVLEPGGLREAATAFAQRPDLGILGAKLMAPDKRTILHCGGTVGIPAHCSLFGRGQRDDGQWDQVREVEFVVGAALVLRRELWDCLGGFDEDFWPAYYEDTDLCHRCRLMGKKVLYWPRLRLVHPGDVSTEYKSWTFYWLHHKNRLWFMFKNFPLPTLLLRAIPAEARWFASRDGAGLRRMMLKIYFLTLKRFIKRRVLRIKRRRA